MVLHEDHASEDGGISWGVSLPIDDHGPEGVRKVAETLASVGCWEVSVVIYGTMLSHIADQDTER
jgi:hypothetical protein